MSLSVTASLRFSICADARRMAFIALCLLALRHSAAGQQPTSTGSDVFINNCVLCHAGDGKGTNRGPSILEFVRAREPSEVAQFLRVGVPDRGMPAFAFPDEQIDRLVGFLATLLPAEDAPSDSQEEQFELADGTMLRGELLNQSGFDAQVRTSDGRIHLLRRSGEKYVPAAVEPNVDWPTYHGNNAANRHSQLNQINRGNVSRLAAEWFFPVPGQRMIEGTPIVIDGVMYITGVNQVFALDAATGRQIWEYKQPRNTGLVGDAAIGLNRGVAIRGDLLFTVTDHAHAIALSRWTGELVWDVEMADSHDHYGAIAAPLVVGELVFFGISGGDTGLRGFLDAYYAATGERAWRFWTIPAPGEPGSETWGDPRCSRRAAGPLG